MTGMTFPELIHNHAPDNWHAVIGGAVYRGACSPGLAGNYYFSDNTFGGLQQGTYNPMAAAGSRLTASAVAGVSLSSPSSIHADSGGELYATDTSGNIWHVEAAP
jgi:hypothetical protein